MELWIIDVAAARARRLGQTAARPLKLDAVLGEPCNWMPNSMGLLCTIIPGTRGAAPLAGQVPTGPHVSESLGKTSPAPTFEDMLKTPDDEAAFTFYATSQLALVSLTGRVMLLPVQGLLDTATPSPDGNFVLVQQLHTPFSYAFPADMFPQRTSVLALASGVMTPLYDRPVVDYLPIANDAVPMGPRDYAWRSDAPATLTWIEAGDGGDPSRPVAVRDRVLALSAPFSEKPAVVLESPLRVADLNWASPQLALATETRWSDRRLALVAFQPALPAAPAVTLYEGSSQDRYHSPGTPLVTTNAAGFPVLQLTPDARALYFTSTGATPTGDAPFLATMPVTGGEETILLRSADPFYVQPIKVLGPDTALVRRESATEPPNYFVMTLRGRVAPLALTHFPSPYAGIALPTKQLLKYRRADGVDLTATLWLPAGYDKSQGPLPTLMEAYPAEFKTRATAGQVAGSPNRFPRIGAGTPIFFTATGYAVLENASIPIIGEGTAQPNDTYIDQLVAGARAALDYTASLGVVDPKRVAVMGHSYGAFMTANLLAHSDLFRAGIARSGAYNRTLTPYGFQAEERTYWQAPETYFKMSPFNYADKIKTPILLIHGEADDNTGTYPIQSERFYAALKGQGAVVRLVFLPLEAHGYEAHESLQHMLWEMNTWLDTYVKPHTPAVPKAGR